MRRNQKKRSHVAALWNVEGDVLAAKIIMDRILVDFFRWPCDIFFPEDKCNALFFYPFGDLLDVEGYVTMEKYFASFERVMKFDGGLTYLEFLETIA